MDTMTVKYLESFVIFFSAGVKRLRVDVDEEMSVDFPNKSTKLK